MPEATMRTPAANTYRVPNYDTLIEYGEPITFDRETGEEVYHLDGFYYNVEWPQEDLPFVTIAHEEYTTV